MFSSNQVLEAAKFWAATVRLLRRDRHMMQRISKNRSSEFPSPATSGKFITFGYDRIWHPNEWYDHVRICDVRGNIKSSLIRRVSFLVQCQCLWSPFLSEYQKPKICVMRLLGNPALQVASQGGLYLKTALRTKKCERHDRDDDHHHHHHHHNNNNNKKKKKNPQKPNISTAKSAFAFSTPPPSPKIKNERRKNLFKDWSMEWWSGISEFPSSFRSWSSPMRRLPPRPNTEAPP